MSYIEYVVAAYAVFFAVLAWDFVAPRVRVAQLMRALRLVASRRAAAARVSADETVELSR